MFTQSIICYQVTRVRYPYK